MFTIHGSGWNKSQSALECFYKRHKPKAMQWSDMMGNVSQDGPVVSNVLWCWLLPNKRVWQQQNWACTTTQSPGCQRKVCVDRYSYIHSGSGHTWNDPDNVRSQSGSRWVTRRSCDPHKAEFNSWKWNRKGFNMKSIKTVHSCWKQMWWIKHVKNSLLPRQAKLFACALSQRPCFGILNTNMWILLPRSKTRVQSGWVTITTTPKPWIRWRNTSPNAVIREAHLNKCTMFCQ